MHTEEQLKPYEAAARIYCAKIGADPDEPIALPHPIIQGAVFSIPTWTDVAERMLDLSVLLSSIRQARDEAARTIDDQCQRVQ